MPFAKTNGINVSYRAYGEGQPLLLIMGLGSSQSTWSSQVPAFSEHYRVITFDNRGVGESDKPPGPYSIRQMADDTVGLMDALGITKAHVLGASMGGTIAQELAINYPEKISKLVLACTYACHDANNGRTQAYDEAMGTAIRNRRPPAAKYILNKWIYRALASLVIGRQYSRLSDADWAAIAAQFEAAGKHNAADRLARIKAPTLVIVGTGDKAIKPSSSENLARLIPNSKLVRLAKGSHGFAMEMRGRFNGEVLSFLKTTSQ